LWSAFYLAAFERLTLVHKYAASPNGSACASSKETLDADRALSDGRIRMESLAERLAVSIAVAQKSPVATRDLGESLATPAII
jgi:hypothetical protein